MATIAASSDLGARVGAYRLRFDRAAAWLAWASGLIWVVLLLRGTLFTPWLLQPGIESELMPLEASLRDLSASHGALWIGGGLLLFAAVDAGLGLWLRHGSGRARTAAFIRAAVGLGLCAAYYLITRDFVSALVLAAIQGGIVVFLTRNSGLMLAYPSMVFLGIFFVVPLFSVLAFSLGKGTALGTVNLDAPGLHNYVRLLSPVGNSGLVYVTIIARTVLIALANTLICLLIAYPFAWWMARQPERMRNILMMLVMIPFWTNLLIRTYAWLIILRKDGLINNFLMDVLGVIDKPLEMTNTLGALLLGLVYGYLPYMILPLYTTIERLDKRYIEASSDLYATPWQSFWRVILPLTMPGIIAGSILVFIPSVGTYVVTNVLGGGKIYLIGNLLEQQFMTSNGDKAFGAAFGVVLTVLMLIGTMVYFRMGRKDAYA